MQEFERLLGPRQHRFGDFFGFAAAAHESLAGFAIVLETAAARASSQTSATSSPWCAQCRQRVGDFAMRDEGERA